MIFRLTREGPIRIPVTTPSVLANRIACQEDEHEFRLLFATDDQITEQHAPVSLRIDWDSRWRKMKGCTLERSGFSTLTYDFRPTLRERMRDQGPRSTDADLMEAIEAALENREPHFDGKVEVLRTLEADLWTVPNGQEFQANLPDDDLFGAILRRLDQAIHCESRSSTEPRVVLRPTYPVHRVLR